MTHDRLLFSHPVLRPDGLDYTASCKFDVNISVKSKNKNIHLDIQYDLTSNFLNDLIQEHRAEYLAVIKCTKTGQRTAYKSENDIRLELDGGEFRDKLQVSTYIVAKQDLAKFHADEHDIEIRGIAENIPTGSILALTNQREILLDKMDGNVQAIIQLSDSLPTDDWSYNIVMNEDLIEIKMNAQAYRATMYLRSRNPKIIFPLLYVPAIENAIRRIKEDNDLDSLWARVIQNAIRSKDIDIDKADPNHIAQKLMEYPYSAIDNLLESSLKDDDVHE